MKKQSAEEKQKTYYAYLARCADDTLYAGYTDDIAKREKAHNAGTGAKYTKSRRPVRIVYFEEFDTKQEAMSREWHLKKLSRTEKLQLIADRAAEESAGIRENESKEKQP